MTKYRLLIASALAAIIGLIFLFIGDGTDQGASTTGIVYIVLRYFHPLTWLLLAVFFWLWHRRHAWRDYVGYAALVCYIVFLLVTFI